MIYLYIILYILYIFFHTISAPEFLYEYFLAKVTILLFIALYGMETHSRHMFGYCNHMTVTVSGVDYFSEYFKDDF